MTAERETDQGDGAEDEQREADRVNPAVVTSPAKSHSAVAGVLAGRLGQQEGEGRAA